MLVADSILVLHFAFVCFVVGSLILIIVGGYCNWRWIGNLWFRLLHLLAISVVVVQTWLGISCPLTTLEVGFRQQAGEAGYATGFIQYWLHKALYYEAPDWLFTIVYSLFALLVVLVWYRFPPQFNLDD